MPCLEPKLSSISQGKTLPMREERVPAKSTAKWLGLTNARTLCIQSGRAQVKQLLLLLLPSQPGPLRQCRGIIRDVKGAPGSTAGRAVSQNHRITECSGLEGTSVGHPVQPPAQAGSPRAGCTGPRPGGAGISPEKETPQPPWAACSRAPVSHCWKPFAGSQLAGLPPACLPTAGWPGCRHSCSALGKRLWQPGRADTRRRLLSLQSSAVGFSPAVNTYPQHSSLGRSGAVLWVSGHCLFCVEMGTGRDFILLLPSGWGNCYLPAANSTNLPSSLETSDLAFSLVNIKNCFLPVPGLSPPSFSVTKYTHSNQNDSWSFNRFMVL